MQKLDVSMSPCLHVSMSPKKLPPCILCKMGADEKRTHSPCWGDEVLILVAWLAFGFWHQPTHGASAETKFTWGLPCQKEDDKVCSQSSSRCQRHCQHRLKKIKTITKTIKKAFTIWMAYSSPRGGREGALGA